MFWGMILIALGVLFLLDNLEIADFGEAVRTYWPALLILWGVSILLKKPGRSGSARSGSGESGGGGQESTSTFTDAKENTESELFHKSSVFGNIGIDITSGNFKGGSVSTVAGDCDVDLTKAVIADGEHWLRVNGVFGSVRVVLPKDTAVSVSAHTVFGEVEVLQEKQSGFSPHVHHASPGYEGAPKKLKILVNQVFGDVRIR